MKAIYINEHGGRDKLLYGEHPGLADQPLPPQSLLIKNKFAGINFIDVYLREGTYPVESFPFVPGKEGLGEVVAIGEEVTDFKEGDLALVLMGGSGSYAEEMVVDAKAACRIEAEWGSLPNLLALGLQGFTAHYLSHDSYPIYPGDTVLIHAGAGGVGHLLIQMAKLKGARVITTVSTEEKKTKVLSYGEYGADEVIIYKNYQFEEAVFELTDGRGVNAVYDSVGQATFDQSLKVIMPRGTMVTYGQSSGVIPPFNVGRLNQEGSLFLTRPSLGHFILSRKEIDRRANDIFSWFKKGQLKVEVGKTYPLQNAAQAHEDLEARRSTGKLVLQV